MEALQKLAKIQIPALEKLKKNDSAYTDTHVSMVTHILTNSKGTDLKALITKENKYNIVILSKPYNCRGAYYPLEKTFINIEDKMYNSLTQKREGSLKSLYVDYYNNVKTTNEKNDKPNTITENDIDSIQVHVLPLTYQHYWNR